MKQRIKVARVEQREMFKRKFEGKTFIKSVPRNP